MEAPEPRLPVDPLPLLPETRAGIQREWHRLGSPGTWWSAEDRVAIAQVARHSVAGRSSPEGDRLGPRTRSAAALVASEAHSVTRAVVDELAAEGVTSEGFVEIVGVVARVTAVDTALRGLGAAPARLPEPREGRPSRQTVPAAARRGAYVPMVGPPGATSALSAVPAEDQAQEDLHGALYLTYQEMAQMGTVRQMPRWQLELAAARTSWLNSCRY